MIANRKKSVDEDVIKKKVPFLQNHHFNVLICFILFCSVFTLCRVPFYYK